MAWIMHFKTICLFRQVVYITSHYCTRLTYALFLFVVLSVFVGLTVCKTDDVGEVPLIQGYMTINNTKYRAICNCNTEPAGDNLPEGTAMCNPQHIKINRLKDTEGGIKESQIQQLWGQPPDVIVDSVSGNYFACMDDRQPKSSLYAPGGDLGLLALGLTAASLNLNEKDLTDLLRRYALMNSKQIYFCTDDEAVEHLEKYLGIEGLDLTSPPQDIRDDILKTISEPKNIGDIHFRMMIKHSGWYHVDAGLISGLMKAFYNLLWNTDDPMSTKLILDVVAGRRNPAAFIEVTTSSDCEVAGLFPLLPSRTKEASAVCVHPNAMSAQEKTIAKFLVDNEYSKLPVETLLSRMDRYGATWIEATGSVMAKDLPFFRLGFI